MGVHGQKGEHSCRVYSHGGKRVFRVRQAGQMVRVEGVGKSECYSVVCDNMTEASLAARAVLVKSQNNVRS